MAVVVIAAGSDRNPRDRLDVCGQRRRRRPVGLTVVESVARKLPCESAGPRRALGAVPVAPGERPGREANLETESSVIRRVRANVKLYAAVAKRSPTGRRQRRARA